MSRRAVYAALALVAFALPTFAQYSVVNANGYQLDNGTEGWYLMNGGTTIPTVGNVNGLNPPVVNLTANDQMFYNIMPKEYCRSSNGTNPGTIEMVGQQAGFLLSMWGSGGGVELFDTIWDQSINTVTYTNPISGAGPDGRRYPDLTPAGYLVLIQGGPAGFAPVGSCAAPNYWAVQFTIEYGTATPGSGIVLPADGVTDLAICCWSPGNMSTLPPDPTGCENGGNLAAMWRRSNNERVALGVTNGAATPTPAGNDRNPYSGRRLTAVDFNNEARTGCARNRVVYRDPILQQVFTLTPFPPLMTGPEAGSGALNMDGSGAAAVSPGFRTEASGHLGELVIHVLNADYLTYPPYGQPGIPITPTANLIVNAGDPNFFLLTPVMDTTLATVPAAWGNDGHGWTKDIATTPLPFAITGPFAAPGIKFFAQAFVVNLSVSPVTAVSTNVIQGNLF
jgi:hypothetical protein